LLPKISVRATPCTWRRSRHPEPLSRRAISRSAKSRLDKLSGRSCRRVYLGTSLPSARRRPQWFRPSASHPLLSWVCFESRLAARSTGRSTKLHGLLPPILSVHSQRLAHLLWYCHCEPFFLFGGCTHRGCHRDNRYRGQSDHHLAYHGAHSNVRTRTPAMSNMKLNSSDTVARVRQYRAVSSEDSAAPDRINNRSASA
jgi:hypothetical protein